MQRRRRAFTLTELLVVLAIVLLVSVVALPTIVASLGDRTMLNATQALQGALVTARDGAVLAGMARGVRLVPSAVNAGEYDRLAPLVQPPNYTSGLVTITGMDAAGYTATYGPTVVNGRPCLVLEASPGHWVDTGGGTWTWEIHEHTCWYGNIRLGDRIRINGGRPYTVCGPFTTDSSGVIVNDLAVSADPLLLSHVYTAPDGMTTTPPLAPEFLLLCNGIDDNGDGFVDNGWDGIDNDNLNGVDDVGEWETEAWGVPAGANLPYSITRRPVVGKPELTVKLLVPVNLAASVIDPAATPPVPTLYVNPLTRSVDLMIQPNGTVDTSGPYAAPSAVSLRQAYSRFMFVNPDGHTRSLTIWHRTGLVESDVDVTGKYSSPD